MGFKISKLWKKHKEGIIIGFITGIIIGIIVSATVGILLIWYESPIKEIGDFFEGPIYITTTKIQEAKYPTLEGINKAYKSDMFLIDNCDERILLSRQVPATGLITENYGFSELISIGPNKSWSISIVTEREKGKIPLKIYSFQSNFKIDVKDAAVQNLEQGNIPGLWSINFDVALDYLFDKKANSIMKIVPEKGDLKVECLAKNCFVTEVILNYVQLNKDWNYIDFKVDSFPGKEWDSLTFQIPPFKENTFAIYQFDFEQGLIKKPSELGSEMETYIESGSKCKEGWIKN